MTTLTLPFIPLWKILLPGLVAGLILPYRSWRPSSSVLAQRSHPWLSSGLEVKAYRRLEQLYAPDRYLISAHMLLADVVGRQNLSTLSHEDRTFCWKAHSDFVVVDRHTLSIQKVIEVNGPHHASPKQMSHDRRKSRILASMGILLDIW